MNKYTMNNIDNGDINLGNIVEKMELMKILILGLQTDLKQDDTIEKERTEMRREIIRIQMRSFNDLWNFLRLLPKKLNET